TRPRIHQQRRRGIGHVRHGFAGESQPYIILGQKQASRRAQQRGFVAREPPELRRRETGHCSATDEIGEACDLAFQLVALCARASVVAVHHVSGDCSHHSCRGRSTSSGSLSSASTRSSSSRSTPLTLDVPMSIPMNIQQPDPGPYSSPSICASAAETVFSSLTNTWPTPPRSAAAMIC